MHTSGTKQLPPDSESKHTCPDCGSPEVSTHTRLDAHICRGCDARWAETTPTERAIEMASLGDEVSIDGLGDGLKVDFVSRDGTRVELSRGDEDYTVRTGEKTLVLDFETDEIVQKGAVIRHTDDPWSE